MQPISSACWLSWLIINRFMAGIFRLFYKQNSWVSCYVWKSLQKRVCHGSDDNQKFSGRRIILRDFHAIFKQFNFVNNFKWSFQEDSTFMFVCRLHHFDIAHLKFANSKLAQTVKWNLIQFKLVWAAVILPNSFNSSLPSYRKLSKKIFKRRVGFPLNFKQQQFQFV